MYGGKDISNSITVMYHKELKHTKFLNLFVVRMFNCTQIIIVLTTVIKL